MLNEKTMAAIAILNVPNISKICDIKISSDSIPVDVKDLYKELCRTDLGTVMDLYMKYCQYLTHDQKVTFRIYLQERLDIKNNIHHELGAILLALEDSSWLKYLFENNRLEACFVFFTIAKPEEMDGTAKMIENELSNTSVGSLDPKHVYVLINKYNAYESGMSVQDMLG